MSTVALKQWIVEQLDLKHSPQSLFDSMLQSGWKVDQAKRALEEVMGIPFEIKVAGAVTGAATTSAAASAASAGAMAAVPVPEPAMMDYPTTIKTSDRTISVLAVMKHPRVVVFGNVLSPDECKKLMELARPKLSRALTVDRVTGGEEINAARTSDGMFFQRGEGAFVTKIEKRLAELVNWPYENGEGLQILRYGPGNQYEPHNDYFDPQDAGTPKILERGGQRVGTIVMYLQSPQKGGGTVFPDVGFEVAPIAGNAVFFSYNKAHSETKTLHGGQPIIEGEKWIATKWMRERVFI